MNEYENSAFKQKHFMNKKRRRVRTFDTTVQQHTNITSRIKDVHKFMVFKDI